MYKKNPTGLVAVFLFVIAGSIYAQQESKLVNPVEAYNLLKMDDTIVLLDVRTPAEFKSETGHLKGAILIPVQELENRIDEIVKYKKRTVIVYCRTGHRSTAGAEILSENGFKAFNMTGGITRWTAEKFPVEKNTQ